MSGNADSQDFIGPARSFRQTRSFRRAGSLLKRGGALRSAICILPALMCSCVPVAGPGGREGSARPAASPSVPGSLRVMSFNIRYDTANDGPNAWRRRREMVFGLLRAERPDVAGLQEVLHAQFEDLANALPEYGRLGVGRDDGKTAGEYAAILYRRERFRVEEQGTFWLSDTPEVPGSISWGNGCTRVCTWARLFDRQSGRAFYFYNTHLDNVSALSREKGARLIAQRIAARSHRDPFILTGDLNVGENDPPLLFLKGEGSGQSGAQSPVPMRDTFRVLHPDAADVGTYHAFGGERGGAKIDYILAPAGIQINEAAIPHTQQDGRYPSDHFPVTALIRLPESWEGP